MNIKEIFQNGKWKRTPEFTAAAAAVVYGFLVHSFAWNNILSNHDNIATQPGGFGMGVALGRWFLEYLGTFVDKIGLAYNLPSVNGMAYVFVLAVSAAFLVSVLRVENKVSAGLIGALFVAFPTVTATMIYRYTVFFLRTGNPVCRDGSVGTAPFPVGSGSICAADHHFLLPF